MGGDSGISCGSLRQTKMRSIKRWTEASERLDDSVLDMLGERTQSMGLQSRVKDTYIFDNEFLCPPIAKQTQVLLNNWQGDAYRQLFQEIDIGTEFVIDFFFEH